MTTRSCFDKLQRGGARTSMLLGTVAALAFAGSALAQSASSNAVPQAGGYSSWDISFFGGYQWFQFAQNGTIRPLDFRSGGIVGERATQDPSDYFGLEEEFSIGWDKAALLPYGHLPIARANVSARHEQFSIVALAYFTKRESRLRPFIAFGPELAVFNPGQTVTSATVGGTFVYPRNGFQKKVEPAVAYGVGLKYNANPFIGFRLDLRGMWALQPHLGIPNAQSGPNTLYVPPKGYASQLALEGGIVFRLGYHEPLRPPVVVPPAAPVVPPAPPLTISAITGAADVCPGDSLTLRVTASGGAPGQTITYQWSVNNQPVAGATGPTFVVPTANGSGARAISVMASAGGQTANSGPVNVTIRNMTPPTVTVSANPSTIPYGATSQITANATPGQCGGPVTIRLSAAEGSISGNTFNSNGVSFDMNNRSRPQSKPVQITATGTDTKNQTATANTTVTVTLTPEARRLDDIVFQLRSARVNNCGKRLLLEELVPLLRADPGAKVIFIGHRDNNESAASRVDERRVLNAAAIISAARGICTNIDLSRILVNWVGTDQTDQTRPALCGSSTNVREKAGQAVRESDQRAQYRRVEIWFVPSGADMPPGTTGARSAPEREVKALGCPR